jgi:hypothetical protein
MEHQRNFDRNRVQELVELAVRDAIRDQSRINGSVSLTELLDRCYPIDPLVNASMVKRATLELQMTGQIAITYPEGFARHAWIGG